MGTELVPYFVLLGCTPKCKKITWAWGKYQLFPYSLNSFKISDFTCSYYVRDNCFCLFIVIALVIYLNMRMQFITTSYFHSLFGHVDGLTQEHVKQLYTDNFFTSRLPSVGGFLILFLTDYWLNKRSHYCIMLYCGHQLAVDFLSSFQPLHIFSMLL